MPVSRNGPLESNDPAYNAAEISTHDTDVISPLPRALFIGVGGDVVAILENDTVAVTFKNVAAGTILPIRAKVVTTATTATDIVALY